MVITQYTTPCILKPIDNTDSCRIVVHPSKMAGDDHNNGKCTYNYNAKHNVFEM